MCEYIYIYTQTNSSIKHFLICVLQYIQMYELFNRSSKKKIITGEHINDIFNFIHQFSPRRPRLLTAAGVSGLPLIALSFIEVMHNQLWL